MSTKQSLSSGTGFFIEGNFYEQAEAFRLQFDRKVSSSGNAPANANPLLCTDSKDSYRHLVGMGENLFGHDLLFDFLDRLRAWSVPILGTSYASTPRVLVYLETCGRRIVRDDIKAQWHYMYSLTRDIRDNAVIKIVTDSMLSGQISLPVTVSNLVSVHLKFNDLLVHSASQPYGIDPSGGSNDPLEAAIYLDGYLW